VAAASPSVSSYSSVVDMASAILQFKGGHDLLAEVEAGDTPRRGKGKRQKGEDGAGIGALPDKKAKRFTAEEMKDLKMWESMPRYDFEQGMVLKLEPEGKEALKIAFRKNNAGLAYASSTQGIYWRACYDGQQLAIWKQAVTGMDGNPAAHGWFMHYETTARVGGKHQSGWYISKDIYEDDEGAIRCYKHNDGGVAGWFGNSDVDMSGPVYMPYYASQPVDGINIIPWSQYVAEMLHYVLLMGAYIELDVMGASIL
jgi:hypothetical protein